MDGTTAAFERSFIGRYFRFSEHGTTLWRGTAAGETTLVVMS
jgi:xanthine/uracil/vitamin C permease (AzgA family)